jgi:hypothetical protein
MFSRNELCGDDGCLLPNDYPKVVFLSLMPLLTQQKVKTFSNTSDTFLQKVTGML